MSNPIAKVSLYRLDGELRGTVLRTYEGASLLPLGDHDVYAAPVTAANHSDMGNHISAQQPVNQQLLAALKMVLDDPDALDGRPRTYKFVMESIAAAEAAQPVAASYPCWSCNKPVTIDQRGEADGNCPHCHAELDEDNWPDDATDRSVKILQDFAVKFGKDDAAEGLLEFYARKHYEQGIADAIQQPASAQPVTVPDAGLTRTTKRRSNTCRGLARQCCFAMAG